jgi:tRNA pseudouridine55 synthase
MQDLVRTRVGEFLLEDAITLKQVEQLAAQDYLKAYIVPVDKVFASLPEVVVPVDLDRLVDNGNSFLWEQPYADGANVRVYKGNRTFIGIYQYDAASRFMKPVKLFFVEMG